jgi:signal transduction histidine kinase
MVTSDIPPQKDSTILILNQLKDIASAVMGAAEAGSLEQVLQRIAHVSSELVNARYAALGVPDGNGGLKYFKVAGMSPDQIGHINHLPFGHGLLGAIMHERKAVRLERMQDDARSGGFCSGHPTMTSLLGVPIQVGEQFFGILYLCDRRDSQPFNEQDEWLIETVAGYAALAIAGSQLGEKQSRLTLLEERERIGMELHDGIIQSLYAIGMQLQVTRLNHPLPEDVLGEPVKNLDTVIEDIRRYILNLKVTSYTQRNISETMYDLVARSHVPETLRVEIDAPDRLPPFAPPVFEAVCQIAYEALSNAIRHANAQYVQIRVTQTESIFQMVIEDDGQGFDLNHITDHHGLGLRNIQQRARIHGGSVDIQTAPDKGTRLTISVPILPV